MNNSAAIGGALYFGDYHKGIKIAESLFLCNVADDGAALYATQFNSGVIVADSVLRDNVALNEGGALYVSTEDLICMWRTLLPLMSHQPCS